MTGSKIQGVMAWAWLIGTALATCNTTTGYSQMVTYVKRRPNLTRQAFWDYWQTQHAPKVIPLATYFNITSYQQIQVGGEIVPTALNATEPASDKLISFDGIALFLYAKPEFLASMLRHPYYIDVVAPDEARFIDKAAFGNGQVATYVGTHISAVDDDRDDWVGNDASRAKYRKLFQSYL